MAKTLPAEDATIPIRLLPPLKKRSGDYYQEPFVSVVTVGAYSACLLGGVHLCVYLGGLEGTARAAALGMMWVWFGLAVVCSLGVLFGPNGEIKRSPETCYPIPQAVRDKLIKGESLDGMSNIPGAEGGSYCVRCLVWRPPDGPAAGLWKDRAHHCSVCQRCVTGFDHHCGVFGRCITKTNMPCFAAINAVWCFAMFTGAVFLIMAVASWSD
eukprot:TRINITY_DN2875_c0_g2_i1.p2 TRINITY_DN2875_c0_g2~~TRINITY_DN2875_c0_g2_i1.p2  ORF type:complete len:212 (+),score=44.78 TRINITY_DN2875_c0_g2_i1:360-995(+)